MFSISSNALGKLFVKKQQNFFEIKNNKNLINPSVFFDFNLVTNNNPENQSCKKILYNQWFKIMTI